MYWFVGLEIRWRSGTLSLLTYEDLDAAKRQEGEPTYERALSRPSGEQRLSVYALAGSASLRCSLDNVPKNGRRLRSGHTGSNPCLTEAIRIGKMQVALG